MLEFESRNLVFKYDGKECRLRFPSAKDWGEYQSKVAEIKDDSASTINAGIDFFVTLGLEKEVAEKLEPFQMEKIIDELSKKN